MPRAVRLCLRAELRARATAWLVLAAVIGLGAGVVLATAAGARRTDSAFARHVSAFRLADVNVSRGMWVDGHETLDLGRVARLPQVSAASRWAQLAAIFRTRSGKPVLPDGAAGVGVGVWLDERGGTAVGRPKVLRGRAPRSGRADEALVDTTAFDRLGYDLGDVVQLRLVSHAALWGRPSAADRLTADPATARVGPLVRVRIVGVFAGTGVAGVPGLLVLPTALYRDHGGANLGAYSEGVSLRLRRGADDVAAFERALRPVAGRGYRGFATPEAERATIQEPIRRQGHALMVLAGLGAVALILFIAQALAREGVLREPEQATLRALGMTRRQLVAVDGCGAAVVGGIASVVAVSVAVLLSPLAPIGRARELEPAPGIAVDLVVLCVGAFLLLAATVAVAVGVGLRTTRAARRSARSHVRARSRWTPAETVARLGFPPTVVSGVRFALTRRRGAAAVPVWTTLTAVVLAVTVVASALTVSRSLSYLLSTPRLYGVNFDYLFWPEGSPAGRLPPQRWVLTDPAIAGVASGTHASVKVDGVSTVAAAYEDVKGTIASATVVQGRAPHGPGEILLAPKTLEATHRHVGDVVTVQSVRQAKLRVVGSGHFLRPLFGNDSFGTGAVLAFSGLKRLDPAAVHTDYRLRIAASADRGAVLDRLERRIGQGRFATPQKIAELDGLAGFPLSLSVLFGAVAATMLAHALTSSVRRRRRELALLKTLGFERRHILATVIWQATTIALIGLAVGLPLGTALARFGWNVYARDLGVLPHVVIPAPQIVALIVGTLLVANVVAALPASIAARTRPAVALRAE